MEARRSHQVLVDKKKNDILLQHEVIFSPLFDFCFCCLCVELNFHLLGPTAASSLLCGILHACDNSLDVSCRSVSVHAVTVVSTGRVALRSERACFCLQGSRFRGLTMGFPPLPQRSSARRSFGRSKRLSLARSLDDLEVGVYARNKTHTHTRPSPVIGIFSHALFNLRAFEPHMRPSLIIAPYMIHQGLSSHRCGNRHRRQERSMRFSTK